MPTLECPHGYSLTITTKDGWPICPTCRNRAKAAAPTSVKVPKITPPKFDVQTLLGDD